MIRSIATCPLTRSSPSTLLGAKTGASGQSLPAIITLREGKGKDYPGGYRLFVNPAEELGQLRSDKVYSYENLNLLDKKVLSEVREGVVEITAEIEPVNAQSVTMDVRGYLILYDTKRRQLVAGQGKKGKIAVDLPLVDGRITLRVFADTDILEIFANDGHTYMVNGVKRTRAKYDLKKPVILRSTGGKATVKSLNIYPLKSI